MKQETPQPEYEEGFVEVAGARVYYLHAGSGRPMLLIHGLVGSSANWRNNIGALAQHASVYAIDLVNMGKSQRVGGLDATAGGDRESHCCRDECAGCGCGGHRRPLARGSRRADAGCAASQPGAQADPVCAGQSLQPRRAILWCGSIAVAWGGLSPGCCPISRPRFSASRWAGCMAAPTGVVDSDLQEIMRIACGAPSPCATCSALLGAGSPKMAKLKAALRRVKRMPTLLIWGDRDCTVSLSSGIKLQRKLRTSELMVLPGGGHSVFEEAPEEANRMMLEWLGRHSSSTSRLRHPPRIVSVAMNSVTHSKSALIDPEVRQSLLRDTLELRKLTG